MWRQFVHKSLLGLLLSGAFFFSLAGTAFADTYTVSITSTQFVPSTLSVEVNDSIRFLNSTTATQSAETTDPDGFDTGNIGPGESKVITVLNAGTFTYSSSFNPALTGTVTVAAGTGTLTDTTTTTTSTASSTLTSQPAKTQAQPVSGVAEVLMAVTAVSFSLIGLGWYSHRKLSAYNPGMVVDLPPISLHNEDDGTVESTSD